MKPFEAVFHAQNDIRKNALIEMLERNLENPPNYPPGMSAYMYAKKSHEAALLASVKEREKIFALNERLASNPPVDEAKQIVRELGTWPEEEKKIKQILKNLYAEMEKEFQKMRSEVQQQAIAPTNGNGTPQSIAFKPNGSVEHIGKAVPRRGRDVDPITELRRALIRQVYKRNRNLKGEVFWAEVQKLGGKPNHQWKKRDCPKTLVEAFRDGKWKKTLTDEKTRETAPLRSPRA
jgi:hypothetical protein